MLNPHYQEAKAESVNWLRDFEALDAKAQSVFDLCDFCTYSLFRYLFIY